MMTHDGYCFYTIGQRKGLGIGGPGGPWFVASKDKDSNTVYVVEGEKHPALYSDYLICSDFDWVGKVPSFPHKCNAKIRYRQADQACMLNMLDDGRIKVDFKESQRAIAISQSVVFYDDNTCLGGAIIKENSPNHYSLNI
jgi:tRNA-specific 2-thiouridylase